MDSKQRREFDDDLYGFKAMNEADNDVLRRIATMPDDVPSADGGGGGI